MVDPLLVVIVGIPVAIHLLLVAVTHWDATDIGVERPRKWTLLVLAVPVYGFVLYLLARSERFYDPEEDPYRDRTYDIHPSRQDDDELE